MPNIAPEYEVVPEFAEISSALVSKYPEIFPGVDADKIQCVAIVNKSRSEKKETLWTVKAVPMPIRMDCPYAWYIELFMDDWVELTKKQRQLLVADALCSIPAGGEEGKVCQPNMKDYSVMLRTFGVDYLKKSDSELRDLVQDNIDWVS